MSRSPTSLLSSISMDSAEDGLSSGTVSHDNAPTLRLPSVLPLLWSALLTCHDASNPMDTSVSTPVQTSPELSEAVPCQPPSCAPQAPGSPAESNTGPSPSPSDAKQDDKPIKTEDDLADGGQLEAGAPVEDGKVKKTRIRERHPRARGGRRTVQEANARNWRGRKHKRLLLLRQDQRRLR